MNNTLDNFQPDNRVFLQLLIAVLCLVFCLFYATYQLRDHGSLAAFDFGILAVLCLPAAFLLRNLFKGTPH